MISYWDNRAIDTLDLSGVGGIQPGFQSLAFQPGFASGYVWVYSEVAGRVCQVSGSGQVTYDFPMDDVHGMAFGAGRLWLASRHGFVYSIMPGDSTVQRTYSLPPGAIGYRGLAWDGNTVWIGRNSEEAVNTSTLLKLSPPPL